MLQFANRYYLTIFVVAISKKIRLSEILEYDLRTVDLECLYMYVHKESLNSDGEQFQS
jgi:hypothetical protein